LGGRKELSLQSDWNEKGRLSLSRGCSSGDTLSDREKEGGGHSDRRADARGKSYRLLLKGHLFPEEETQEYKVVLLYWGAESGKEREGISASIRGELPCLKRERPYLHPGFKKEGKSPLTPGQEKLGKRSASRIFLQKGKGRATPLDRIVPWIRSRQSASHKKLRRKDTLPLATTEKRHIGKLMRDRDPGGGGILSL